MILYVDQSEIRPGRFDDLKVAIAELAGIVEVTEPQLLSYNVYFSDDRTRMTVVHIHSDAASLDIHMATLGPLLPRFSNLVSLLRIDIFGEPSPQALAELRRKAETLGTGTVQVHPLHTGFNRWKLQPLAGE